MPDIKTLEQKKQKALEEAYHLQKQIDEKLDGQKSVLGRVLMAIAEYEPDRIPQILVDINNYVTREADINCLEDFKSSLESKVPQDISEPHDIHMDNFKKLVASNKKIRTWNDDPNRNDDISF